MARPKSVAPSLRYHISGQAVVTINGENHYLGKHNSPESLARYAVLIALYQSGNLSLPQGFSADSLKEPASAVLAMLDLVPSPTRHADDPILIRHVTAAYRELVKKRYANSQSERMRSNWTCDEIDAHDGDMLAQDYGPLALQRQRERWVDSGKSRKYCNRLTNLVTRIFKYAVSQELVTESIWTRLKAVESLREGQTTAPEHEPVRPVPIDDVRATVKMLSPVLRAMVTVQVATGMRPSEVCKMRPADIDRTGDEWMYRPTKHKTASRGKKKAVPIIGDAREALTPYLDRDPDAFCFSPTEAVAWWQAAKRVARKTKVQPSQYDRSKENPLKQPGDRYTPNSYRRAIDRAAKIAGVKPWHPYQLRHLAATVVREAFGPEGAQALLGHSRLDMTEHYAKLSEQKAIDAAKHAPKL